MKQTLRLLAIGSLALSALFLTGCAGLPKTVRATERISAPPAGKALVNFHRPSNYGGAQAFPIFDGNGKMLIDIPGKTAFQHVCDPGEQVFIGWADHVTVVKANLAADKVYDVVIDIGMGWVSANITLKPIGKNDPRRAKLAEFEKREKRVIAINPDSPRVQEYEAKNAARIADIKKDFLSGDKADRVSHLQPEDCR